LYVNKKYVGFIHTTQVEMGDASNSFDVETIREKDGTAKRELEFCVLKDRSHYN